MGLGRFELPTSRLSGVRSNQLSYRPFDTPYVRSVGPEKLVSANSAFNRLSFPSKFFPYDLKSIIVFRFVHASRRRVLEKRRRFNP